METNNMSQGENSGPRVFPICWVFGMVAFLYFGSVGPVWKLQEKHLVSVAAVNRFCAPADAVVSKSPVLERLFHWYIFDLWKVRYTYIY